MKRTFQISIINLKLFKDLQQPTFQINNSDEVKSEKKRKLLFYRNYCSTESEHIIRDVTWIMAAKPRRARLRA